MRTFADRRWLTRNRHVTGHGPQATGLKSYNGGHKNRYSPASIAGIGFALVFAVVAHWFFVEWILASHHGFEFTDEALYLLAAREIGGASQWGFPWGWHTAPFYNLVGGDIADFRTLGGFLLSLAGIFLGISAYLAALARPTLWLIKNRKHRIQILLFGVAGLASTLVFYQGFLRSPSYNWVNLLGILIAFIAGFSLVKRGKEDNSRLRYLAATGVAVGLVFSAPGKPTSPILVLLILFLLWSAVLGTKESTALLGLVTIMGTTLIALLVLVGLWPTDFFQSFYRPLTLPSIMESGGIWAAVGDASRFPQQFFEILGDPERPRAIYRLFLASLVFWGASHFTIKFRSLFRFVSFVMAFASAMLAIPLGASTVWILLLVVTLLNFLSVVAEKSHQSYSRSGSTRILSVATSLASVPFIFGFGSGHGLWSISVWASVGFVLAIMVMLLALGSERWGGLALTSVMVLSIFNSGLVLLQSHQSPYLMAPIAEQSIEVRVGQGSGQFLLVDEPTKQRIESVSRLAEDGGLVQGAPVVGLVWWWNADLTYLSGANVPAGLMVTLFGYEGSVELGIANIRSDQSDFDWANAWVVVNNPSDMDADQWDEVQQVLDELENRTNRRFPEDYVLVGQYAGELSPYWSENSVSPAGLYKPAEIG